jgi:hypothetical protein
VSERRAGASGNGNSLRHAFQTVIVLVALIYLPAIAIVIVTTKTAGPDLFDLTPLVSRSDQYWMLAWPELQRSRHTLHTGSISSGAMIRALGYMMEGPQPVRDGERVQGFVLLPDAGSLWHPAHRFGDEMIDVRLSVGNEVQFAERSLVWVWGTLQMLPGDPSGHQPLYVLENARSEPASGADIGKSFR